MSDGAAGMSEAVVEVRRVSKSFDRRRPILRDVSFSLRRGEMVALIGPSVSGKPTLVRAIARLVPIDKSATGDDLGAAPCDSVLCGEPMQRRGRITRAAKRLRRRIVVVFQQFNL